MNVPDVKYQKHIMHVCQEGPPQRSNHVFFISRLRPMVVVSIAGIKDRKERGCKSDNVLTTECFYFPLVWPSMVCLTFVISLVQLEQRCRWLENIV